MSHFSKNIRAFTLIELLVSIAIVTIILTVLIFNQSTYTDGAALSNLADEIGLSISQAQAYGIGVRGLTTGSNPFNTPYGLTFSLLSSGSNKDYLSFADRNNNQIYDGNWTCQIGDIHECLEKVNITRGNYIYELCRVRNNPNNPYQCNNLARIDISFVRPSPEAKIQFFNNGGNSIGYDPEFIGARISLYSPKGATRSVIVYYTGQISVQ